MIIVFNETCVPKSPFHGAFPIYEYSVGYEVGVSISQADAEKYIADGRAIAAGQAKAAPTLEAKKKGDK